MRAMTDADTIKRAADMLTGRAEGLKQLRDPKRGYVSTSLVTSTAMIPQHTAKALDNDDDLLPFHVDWKDYGWMIWTDTSGEDELRAAGHGALFDLLAFAKEEGFEYVHLDCDAQPLHKELGFPEFTW